MKLHYLVVLLILGGCNMSSSATDLENCERIYQAIERNSALGAPLQKAQEMQHKGKTCIGAK